jgi:hypothetical protein
MDNSPTSDVPNNKKEATLPVPDETKEKQSTVEQEIINQYLKDRYKHIHEKSDGMYQCKKCSFKRPHYSSVIKHVNQVHLKLKVYQCEVCESSFVTSEKLNRHMKVHSSKREFECQHCGKEFKHSSDLNVHVQKKHTDSEKPIACTVAGCNIRFFKYSEQKRHVEQVHDKIRLFQCLKCHQSFSKRNALTRHEQSPTACQKVLNKKRKSSKKKNSTDTPIPASNPLTLEEYSILTNTKEMEIGPPRKKIKYNHQTQYDDKDD